MTVKGKAGPLAVWQAAGTRARIAAEVLAAPATPFVGRAEELAALRSALGRTVRERAVQLVTITGEPGVGKSRLVRELAGVADDAAELISWRQGHCLPYGDGVTFWALGEIVKAEAGILESDGEAAARAKLTTAVEAVTAEDRAWLIARLGPLVGLTGDTGVSAGPGGVVHRLAAVPGGGGRRAPAGGGGRGRALGRPGAARLPGAPGGLGRRGGAAGGGDRPPRAVCSCPGLGRRQAQRHHAGASPARRRRDRPAAGRAAGRGGAAGRGPGGAAGAGRRQPAVRRAVRPPDQRAGPAHPPGPRRRAEPRARPAAARHGDRADRRPAGHPCRPGTSSCSPTPPCSAGCSGPAGCWPSASAMRPRSGSRCATWPGPSWSAASPTARSTGQDEYAFWHALVRDVAYRSLPRKVRAARHLAAARWLEQLAGDRVADHAEQLAHHYLTALERTREAATRPAPARSRRRPPGTW